MSPCSVVTQHTSSPQSIKWHFLCVWDMCFYCLLHWRCDVVTISLDHFLWMSDITVVFICPSFSKSWSFNCWQNWNHLPKLLSIELEEESVLGSTMVLSGVLETKIHWAYPNTWWLHSSNFQIRSKFKEKLCRFCLKNSTWKLPFMFFALCLLFIGFFLFCCEH